MLLPSIYALVLTTPCAAQELVPTTGAVGWLTKGDERFRDRFHQLLLSPQRDLQSGWQLAVDFGRPAVPLLWDLLQKESSNLGRRLPLLSAAVLAGGPGEDERLFAWLDQPKAMPWERVLAATLLALGPRRQRPVANFWARCIGPTKSPDEILLLAVRLAAARFPDSDEGAPLMFGEDPGLAAATAYAGLPLPASLTARLWNLGKPERHAELFWRGALLSGARQRGEGVVRQDDLLERAREVMQLGGQATQSARWAAASFRLRAKDVRVEGTRPDWRLLQALAAETQGAEALQAWLGPVPQPRDEEPARLAVCYALSRSIAAIWQDRALWGTASPAGKQGIGKHVAVALAWRLLGEAEQPPATPQGGQDPRLTLKGVVDLPGVPEAVFVRWAAGGEVDHGVAIEDTALRAAARLMAEGRMPRAALRTVLEEALWRWGSHPGLSMWESERLLIRDLLLVGSNQGGGKYMPQVPPERRYRPQSIGPDVFFEVAVSLYEFLGQPRLPVPPEHRLR